MIKKWIPNKLKIKLKITFQLFKDWLDGSLSKLVDKTKLTTNYPIQFSISQPIKRSEGFDAKLHNLKLASKAIDSILIKPNQLFSFWHFIGNPSAKRDYQKGRSLENGIVNFTSGGGLCQLSGLIYHISLLANLKTIERYNHSLDLYNEHTRFTPLGSDATVVYGNKDLRFTNNLNQNIYFSFIIKDETITCNLHSDKNIVKNEVSFVNKQENQKTIKVQTFIKKQYITSSIYHKKKNT